MMNPKSLVVVAEPEPRWTLLLSRFAPRMLVTRATTLALAEDYLRTEQPVFLCVSALLLDRQEKLVKLARLLREYPAARGVVCITASIPSSTSMPELIPNDLYYAAGVQGIFFGIASLPACIRMARRYFKAQPAVQLPWRAEIAAKLPWQPVRSNNNEQ